MKDGNVLVTIRCLAYNHEAYIHQCLEGFVMQKTNFRFEAIVHDDASTDSTAEIIREYANKYPDIIKPIFETENQYSKHDGSLRRIMNSHTRGKYVAICEGDDYWIDPFKLQKQVDFLEKNIDYSLIYTGVYKVNSESNDIKRNFVKGVSGNITKYFFEKGNPIITPSVCFKTKDLLAYNDEIEKINFELKMGDLPLWIYLSRCGKVKFLKDKTVAYRVLAESASHSLNKNKIISFIENSRDILFYFNECYKLNIPNSVIEKRFYLDIIRNMVPFGVSDFFSYYLKGVAKYPSLLLNMKLLLLLIIKVLLRKKVVFF